MHFKTQKKGGGDLITIKKILEEIEFEEKRNGKKK